MAGAEDRIYAAKERDRGKPIPLLVSGMDEVMRAGGLPGSRAKRLARRCWPGPLTLVLNCGGKTEGFRVPNHSVALAVLKAAGGMLRVTSANLSGEPAARTAREAVAALGSSVSVVLDAGPATLGQESTVVRDDGNELTILRQGFVPREEIMKRRLVLFVCTGNVCRSPMAEALLRHWLGSASEWDVESAGVAAFDGLPASEAARVVMAEKKIDLGPHRSQSLEQALVDDADLIVVMTADHQRAVRSRFLRTARKVFLLNAFSNTRRNEDVEDPIGTSNDVYRGVRDEMNAVMPDLVMYLHEKMKP